MTNVKTLMGKPVRNSLQPCKLGHGKEVHRMIESSKIKGTDATNKRPLANAPFHPSYNNQIAIKGRSADDKVPGNVKSADYSGMPLAHWVLIGGLGFAIVYAITSRN